MGKIAKTKNIEEEIPINPQKTKKPNTLRKKIAKKVPDMEKEKQQRQRVKQKTQPKQKKIVPAVLYKQFKTEQEAKELLPSKGLSKGQKQRQVLQKSLKRKRLFQEYLRQAGRGKPNPTNNAFLLDGLKQNIEQIEAQNKVQQAKQVLRQHQGVSSGQRDKLEYKSQTKHRQQDQERMRQILNLAPFQQNPLSTLRMHIENSLKLQGKM